MPTASKYYYFLTSDLVLIISFLSLPCSTVGRISSYVENFCDEWIKSSAKQNKKVPLLIYWYTIAERHVSNTHNVMINKILFILKWRYISPQSTLGLLVVVQYYFSHATSYISKSFWHHHSFFVSSFSPLGHSVVNKLALLVS